MECYRHAITAEFFEHWFETWLLEAIPWGEGYTVTLDNAWFPPEEGVAEAGAREGASAVPSSVLA